MKMRNSSGRVVAVSLGMCLAGCTAGGGVPSATALDSSLDASASISAPHPFEGNQAWIAYQTYRAGGEGVWLIRPDGSEDHEIALDVPGERLHPDWSPDGTRLVVTSRRERDVLYLVDLASDSAEVLFDCSDACVGDDEAVWSPDGDRIAFVRAMEPFVDDAPTCALFIGEVESRDIEQVGEARRCWDRETFPHWSRDGTRLAYYRGVYEGDATLSTALYVLDIGSGDEAKLTDDALFAGDSDWSSGDEWIVFSTYPLNDFQCCQVSNLHRIHPDGTGLEQLTFNETDELRATQPRYTPDGASIIFTAVTSTGRTPWVIPADGGDPVAVVNSGLYTHPAWQPEP